MTEDYVRFDLNGEAVIRAFKALPDDMDKALLEAGRITADNIAREARARLERQLGPAATGKTAAGIQVQPARQGRGWAVVDRRDPYPMLPKWLDKGTKHAHALDFFDSAVALEAGAHDRRVHTVVGQVIVASGLGD